MENTDNQELFRRLENDHIHHPPKEGQPTKHNEVRARALEYAKFLVCTVPSSRELSIALTKIEEVVFFANAGIARHGE